ncbi:MAG TPA: hypothetical protein VLN49_22990 [Gemmatimonadaceae bacterium]|nr:hypothetical protein [Gemmatimonadaceae bacterium]
MRKLSVAAATLVLGFLIGSAWAYLHADSHATLGVTVIDVADSAHGGASAPVEVAFLDSGGSVLARAMRDSAIGGINLASPAEYACHEIERHAAFSAEARRDWDRCFERQSRWIPHWIKRVAALDVRVGPCSLHQVRAPVDKYPDPWWLWWFPNPHVGGAPYTNYSIALRVDSRRCASVA